MTACVTSLDYQDRGWTKNHRRMFANPDLKDARTLGVFTFLIGMAEKEPRAVEVPGGVLQIDRGQVFFRLKDLCERLNLTTKQARIILQKFADAGMIETAQVLRGALVRALDRAKGGALVGTLLTLRNYCKYQGAEKDKGIGSGDGEGIGKGRLTRAGIPGDSSLRSESDSPLRVESEEKIPRNDSESSLRSDSLQPAAAENGQGELIALGRDLGEIKKPWSSSNKPRTYETLPTGKDGKREYPAEFEELWAAYPQREQDTKAGCYARWRRAVTDKVRVRHEDMLAAAQLVSGNDDHRLGFLRWLRERGWLERPVKRQTMLEKFGVPDDVTGWG